MPRTPADFHLNTNGLLDVMSGRDNLCLCVCDDGEIQLSVEDNLSRDRASIVLTAAEFREFLRAAAGLVDLRLGAPQ